mmetsp:Transcript_7692/g.22606  ORF Transcript_7692/g.22606 Transcript_7692/m.22606 type:complete len:85 (-) Transcript_7692:1412-1666(-)
MAKPDPHLRERSLSLHSVNDQVRKTGLYFAVINTPRPLLLREHDWRQLMMNLAWLMADNNNFLSTDGKERRTHFLRVTIEIFLS